MTRVRDRIAQFIQAEGHRVDVSVVRGSDGIAELLFRTRGQVYSITTNEQDASTFEVATAYEIPDFARNDLTNDEALASAREAFPDALFAFEHDGALFVASVQEVSSSPEAFIQKFWGMVARVRAAGTYAIERIVDHSESKAAADKFIKSLTIGER